MNETITIHYFKTQVGELILGSYHSKLCLADWRYRKMRSRIDQRLQKGVQAKYELGTSPVIEQTKKELLEYFQGKRKIFEIPIHFVGTVFQQTVWMALQKIPFGETRSYLELSKQLNNPKAVRAVASANGANAISIIVPCHRIIGADGNLVGYAGGLATKKKLLKIEGSCTSNQLKLF